MLAETTSEIVHLKKRCLKTKHNCSRVKDWRCEQSDIVIRNTWLIIN